MRQLLQRLARSSRPTDAPCPGKVTGFTLTLDEVDLIERLRSVGTRSEFYRVLPYIVATGVTETGVEVLCNLYARGRLYHQDLVRLQADGLLIQPSCSPTGGAQ